MEREGNIGRQPERRQRSSQEPQQPPEWQLYHQWRQQTPFDARVKATAPGEWPEGTPEVVIELHTKTTAEERLLGSIFGEYPSLDEIRSRSTEDVRHMEEEIAQKRRDKLAAQVGEPADTPLTEQELQERHSQMFGTLQEQVDRTLSTLTDRENIVLRGRFGLEDGRSRTQAELADEIGRSPRTVRRIERTALQKLRQPSTQRTLKDFLE